MKYRNIILTVTLSLLALCGLSRMAQGANPAPVTVINTTTNPVPITGTITGTVQNAENPARQAVQVQLTAVNGVIPSAAIVPAGKIFVIEFASFRGQVFGGATLDFVGIQVTGSLLNGGQGFIIHSFVTPPPNADGFTTGSEALRLYAQPNTPISVSYGVSGDVSGASGFQLFVSLSGYLVNAQ